MKIDNANIPVNILHKKEHLNQLLFKYSFRQNIIDSLTEKGNDHLPASTTIAHVKYQLMALNVHFPLRTCNQTQAIN